MSKVRFDFYYGAEAEQFSFYRVPRLLIRDERFRGLSSDAKLLYGLMLDRMALSQKNNWFDDENRAYIIYTIDNMMEDLGCARATCVKVIKELDCDNGIGLIEKKRRGLGKPDIIYVKNFAAAPDENADETAENAGETAENADETAENAGETAENAGETAENADETAEVQKLNFKKFRNYTSRSSETELQEVQKLNFKKFRNQTSRSSETELLEVQKLDPSYTNNNYTDLSYTDKSKKESIYPSIHPSIHPSELETEDDEAMKDGMDAIEALRQQVRENIGYDDLVSQGSYLVKKYAPEIYRLICDIVCVRRNVVRIAGADCPYPLVRERFLELTEEDVEYVVECMARIEGRIGNIRAYLLTALYNAPASREHYYRAEAANKVQRDGGAAAFEAFAARDD